MKIVNPHELFEEFKKELSLGISNIIGPFTDSNGDTGRMLYSLIQKDPGFVKDENFDYPGVFAENVEKYKDYPESYQFIHQRYPYHVSSGVYGGSTHIQVQFDLLESYFVDFFIDRKFDIKLLQQREIQKSHWKLKEDTGTANSLLGIVCKEKIAFSFHCIGGYVSEKDIKYLFNPQAFPKGGTSSFVFNCWGSLHYSD